MVGMADPEMDRHISNFFSKTEKIIRPIKLGHLKKTNHINMKFFKKSTHTNHK